jgi:glycine/D-amino acid oxidase-like deaminating enzyme
MHRREVLRLLGFAATAGFAVSGTTGCAAERLYVVDRSGQRGHPRRFVPVEVRPDRLVRSTVGLRPFRDAGVRLEAEPFDGKQLIHQYGHGGGGITLSWGSAYLAAGLIDGTPPPGPVAVIGAGVVGLTTAILLQRRGYDVTIYAAAAWPHTTSNAAAATFYPSHVVAPERVTMQVAALLEAALARSYHAFQRLVGRRYGVHWLDSFSILGAAAAVSAPAPDVETQVFRKVVGDPSRELAHGEHPFGNQRVVMGRDLVIEPMTYLWALLEDFRLAGGVLRIRRFDTLRDVAGLAERTVFNCTGLGARALVGDTELHAARGQLCVLPPQPEVDYTLHHRPFFYMVPREDGIILGGTYQFDDERTAADEEDSQMIIAAHQAVFDAMG